MWPAIVRRFRIEFATYAAPASVPRIRRPASALNSAHVEGSRARTVNAGAIPVSRDGCPKHSPGSSTWIGSPSWTMSIDPVTITHRPGVGSPSSTSTASPVVYARSVAPAASVAQLVGIERVERRVAGEECVQLLHVEPRNCVRIAPGTCTGHVGA